MPDFLADQLTRAHNFQIALALQTAMELRLPPLIFINEDRQPSDGWSAEDKKLALAWTILQKETCPKCGQPLWICRSSNNMLGFKVRKGLCYATAELERYNEAQEKKKQNLKPGEYLYTVPYMMNDTDLPSRQDWLDEMNEE